MTEPRFRLSDEDARGAWAEQLRLDAEDALARAERVLGLALDAPPLITSHGTMEEFRRAVGANPHNTVAVASASENRIVINRTQYTGTGTADRRQTLVHEFSHLIVGRRIPGGIPRWLDEGLAMIISEDHGFAHGARLSAAATFGTLIPIDRLWETAATGEEAQSLAYAQSLSLTRYYLDTFNKTYGYPADDPSGLAGKLADEEDGKHLRALLHDPNYIAALESNWVQSLNSVWTWIAAFTGGGFFWTGLSFLFLFTYWRKKKLMREKEQQWEEEEDFSGGRDWAMYREEDFEDDEDAEEVEIPGEEDRWV